MKIFNKNEWKKVKLGDVCEVLDSKRVPISEENRIKGEYPYYGANGIQGYINEYIFDEELVLLAEDGGNFGSKTKPIAYKISGKTWVNNHAHVLKAKDEIISTDFLLYSLMFYDVTKLITGTTRKKLTRAGMEKITLSIPTLSIQNKITDYLQKIESFISFRKHQLNSLKELNKSLFTTMFGDIKTNDKNWEIRKIEDCILNNIKNIDLKTNGEITYIDISSINNKENIISSYKKYDNIREAPSRAKKILNENDILISTVRPALKNIAIFNKKNSELTIGSTGFCVLRPKDTIDSKYIFEIIKSNNFTETLIKRQIGANYPAVSDRDIKSIKIPIPPIELQNKFAERVEKIEKLKFEIEKSIEIAQNLYDSLISKYFDN